jgi:hypothetical protein
MDGKYMLGRVDADNGDCRIGNLGDRNANLVHDFPSRLVTDVDWNLHLYTAMPSGKYFSACSGREVPFIR